MASRILFFPLWLFAAALLGLPEETNRSIHTQTSSIVASMLSGHSTPPTATPNDALSSWEEEREEELQAASLESASSLENKYPFIVTNVIFQANTPWSNTVWIDVGKNTKNLAFPIEKNSPIVVRDTLVGIIDFVGSHASRVRLISDPTVRPAVRIIRGNSQVRHLVLASQDIQRALSSNPSLLPKPELTSALSKLLDCLLQSLPVEEELKLAKGELQGAEYSSTQNILRGVGFNYDFCDDEGPARDLRTGQRTIDDQKVLLIKPGDLLETSGLDGIFPKGLRVATVSSVFPLEEGAISYQILAKVENDEFPNFDYLTVIQMQPQGPLQPPTPTDLIKDLIEDRSASTTPLL